MEELTRIILAVILVGAALTLVEWLFPARRRKRIFRREYGLDLQYLVFVPTIGRLLSRGAVIAVLIPAYLLVRGELPDRASVLEGFGPIAAQPAWAQAILLLLVADFIGYWTHRLFHGRRLWAFHAVHHSSEELDWLSSVRQHPVNEALGAVLRALPLLLLGFSPVVIAGLAPLLTLHALLLHANLDWSFGRFRTVIASPVFHRWHHSRDEAAMNKNFAGLFPVWDLLFGTFYMPKGRVPTEFGIVEPMPSTLWGQLAQPFRRNRAEAQAQGPRVG